MRERSGYEKSAHLHDLFDQKENIDFFYHYADTAGDILDVGAGYRAHRHPAGASRR